MPKPGADENQERYNRGVQLFRKGNFSEAAAVLRELPPGYAGNSLWFLAESLYEDGRIPEARDAARRGLELPDRSGNLHGAYYELLAKYAARDPSGADLYTLKMEALTHFRDRDMDEDTLRFHLARAFLQQGITELAGTDPAQAEPWLDEVDLLVSGISTTPRGETLRSYIREQNPEVYRAAAMFWVESGPEGRNQARGHNFLFLQFPELDARWKDMEGESLLPAGL